MHYSNALSGCVSRCYEWCEEIAATPCRCNRNRPRHCIPRHASMAGERCTLLHFEIAVALQDFDVRFPSLISNRDKIILIPFPLTIAEKSICRNFIWSLNIFIEEKSILNSKLKKLRFKKSDDLLEKNLYI